MPRPPASFTPLPVDRSPPAQNRSAYVPAQAVPGRDVAFVPSDPHVVRKMLTFARVTPDDVVYDLGCGDGRIVVAAARDFGATGVGVDVDPKRVEESLDNARRAGVESRVSFRHASLFDTDLRPATVVATYLLPGLNARLKPKYLAELRPGARIVSNHFDMGDWPEDEHLMLGDRRIRKWIVPARVAGRWNCVVNLPDERLRLALDLSRGCQYVLGFAELAGRKTQLLEGRIRARELSFRLTDWSRGGAAWRFTATVEGEGKTLRGTCTLDTSPHPHPWGATRA